MKLKFDKQKFLQYEFGSTLKEMIKAWAYYIDVGDRQNALTFQYRWEVFQLALRYFYGLEYYTTIMDGYFGVVSKDNKDWLVKVKLKKG